MTDSPYNTIETVFNEALDFAPGPQRDTFIAGFAGTLWQLNEARQNAAESIRQVARLNVLTGVNLLQGGNSFRSLLWFAEALSLNADSPERAAVDRIRIASIVAQGPRLAGVITHEGQPVAGAAFHPTRDQLATVGRDRRLRVWNIPTGEMLLMSEPFAKRPSDVLFSPDGDTILVGSSEFNQVQLLSASGGKPLTKPMPHFAGGANNRPLSPRFDSSSTRLLTQSAPQNLRVWDVRKHSPLGPAIALSAPIAWMNFGPDGNSIRVVTQDGRATTWDWTTGSPIDDAAEELEVVTAVQPPEAKVFSRDGSQYATISADHRVRIWNTDTGEPLTPPIDHNTVAGLVEFSASGRFFFTMHPAHAVYVWELNSSAPPVLLRPGAPRTMAEAGQDGSVTVTRDPGSPIRVRALSGVNEVSLHPSSLREIPVQAWFDETGQFIILEGREQHAQIWHAATGLPVTPSFKSHYATNEAGYLNLRFALNVTPEPRSLDSELRSLAELLSGNCPAGRSLGEGWLDGTAGGKPLELDETVAVWNEANGRHTSIVNEENKRIAYE